MFSDFNIDSVPYGKQLLVHIIESGFLRQAQLCREVLDYRHAGLSHVDGIFGVHEILQCD
jgi:hypothetical protein